MSENTNKYLILRPKQHRNSLDVHKLRFHPYDAVMAHGLKITPDLYDTVYAGQIPDTADTENPNRILEHLFFTFNENRPADFHDYSMSVSDIVILELNGERKAYYCDMIGFKYLPDFTWPDMAHVEKRKVWFRLGVTLMVSEQEFRTLAEESDAGEQLLKRMILAGEFSMDGDTYSPRNDDGGDCSDEWYHREDFGYDL